MKRDEVKRTWRSVDHGGPLHILVADHNVEDGHLLFCLLDFLRRELPEVFNLDEVQLIQALEDMSLESREELANEMYHFKG